MDKETIGKLRKGQIFRRTKHGPNIIKGQKGQYCYYCWNAVKKEVVFIPAGTKVYPMAMSGGYSWAKE